MPQRMGIVSQMGERTNIPASESEVAEAAWWFANREEHDRAFAEAIRDRRARRSTLAARVASAKGIVLDAEDETKARELAAQRGLEYKSFVKALLHEALDRV